MSGTKIINVLKDDTFPEILEIFRQSDAGEIIFVLPKKSKVFKREDHFAAFASEAESSGKVISMLCSNSDVNALGRKYKFHIMSASKSMPPEDVIENVDTDFEQDVQTTADELPIASNDEDADETLPDGMHIDTEGDVEEEPMYEAELTVSTMDGIQPGSPRKFVPVKGKTEKPARVDVERPGQADWDYIDAVWREKASSQNRQAPHRPGKRNVSKKIAVGILVMSLVLLGAIVYLTTGSASVKLNPVAKPIDVEIPVQASDAYASVDVSFGKIPGQLYEVAKTATVEAPATGQRDVASKARGSVTIFNKFSSAPQPLIATTRFESADGFVYRILQNITVPGSTVKNGELVAGTVDVDVIADKPGTQYNIPAGKFTVPAFKEHGDTDKYAKIYAQSSEAITGGASGPSKFITQADYDDAKEIATKNVQDDIARAFADQSSGMMILDGVKPVIGQVTGTAKPDDAGDTFSVTVSATLKTIAFRQKDLYQLIADTILKKDRLVVMPDKLTLAYGAIAFKTDVNVLTFTVAAKGDGYMPIDQSSLMNDVRGKTSAGIREYFKNREDIQAATIVLSPFWVTSVPKNPDRIKLQIDYNPITQ